VYTFIGTLFIIYCKHVMQTLVRIETSGGTKNAQVKAECWFLGTKKYTRRGNSRNY
jgi:hypothetical protein